MSYNQTIHGDEARLAVLRGAEALYEAVKVTMGPRGRNVAIERPYVLPIVTHDGVTVAEHIYLNPHKPEQRGWSVGIDLIRQAASTMNRSAGDGTTTVTVLTYHILNEANKLIETGYNPMVLKREIEALAEPLVKLVDELKEPVETEERLAEVATISCADPELGALIARLVYAVGKDGTVTVEEGTGLTIESDITEGYTFRRGWLSPLMITDTKKNEAVLKNPAIYLTDKELTTADDAYKVMEAANKLEKTDLLIVAADVKKDALAYIANIKTQGAMNVVAVKQPGFGDAGRELLADLSTLVGGSINDPAKLGLAKRVVTSKDETTIIEGGGVAEQIDDRIDTIRSLADETTVELEKKLLNDRAAALSGKVAVIKVGGLTDAEVEEKKYRVDDAVAAAKAALSDGIVAGGGVTMVNISDKLFRQDGTRSDGEMIIISALSEPFVQLMTNAGKENIDSLLESLDTGRGFDVMDDSYELIDLKKAGIIDPAQVTKQAISTAISVACTLMTMGALIVNEPEEKIDQNSLYSA
jgi:chaperonin GroEL